MCDIYYKDTKRAMEEVEQIDLGLMREHYSDKIELFVTEAGYLLDEYEKIKGERDELLSQLE